MALSLFGTIFLLFWGSGALSEALNPEEYQHILSTGKPVFPIKNDTKPVDKNLHIFSICSGNYTSCLNGCPHNISRSEGCISCNCTAMPPMYFPMYPITEIGNGNQKNFNYTSMNMTNGEKPKLVKKIDVGPVTLYIGTYNTAWWMRTFPGTKAIKLSGRRYPYVLFDFKRNNYTNRNDLKPLKEYLREANFTHHPILLPVVFSKPQLGMALKNGVAKAIMNQGFLHLPFKVNVSNAHPLPAVAFPNCVLPLTRVGQPSFFQNHTILYLFMQLFSDFEVSYQMSKIFEKNYGKQFNYSDMISCMDGTDWYPGNGTTHYFEKMLLSFLNRFSYFGNYSFSNLLNQLNDTTLSNNNCSEQIRNNTYKIRRLVQHLINISHLHNDENKLDHFKHIAGKIHEIELMPLSLSCLGPDVASSIYEFTQSLMSAWSVNVNSGTTPGYGGPIPSPLPMAEKEEKLLEIIKRYSSGPSTYHTIIQILKSIDNKTLDKEQEESLTKFIYMLEHKLFLESPDDEPDFVKERMSMLIKNDESFKDVILDFNYNVLGIVLKTVKNGQYVKELVADLMEIIGENSSRKFDDISLQVYELIKQNSRYFDEYMDSMEELALSKKLSKYDSDVVKKFSSLTGTLKDLEKSSDGEVPPARLVSLVNDINNFVDPISNFNNITDILEKLNDTAGKLFGFSRKLWSIVKTKTVTNPPIMPEYHQNTRMYNCIVEKISNFSAEIRLGFVLKQLTEVFCKSEKETSTESEMGDKVGQKPEYYYNLNITSEGGAIFDNITRAKMPRYQVCSIIKKIMNATHMLSNLSFANAISKYAHFPYVPGALNASNSGVDSAEILQTAHLDDHSKFAPSPPSAADENVGPPTSEHPSSTTITSSASCAWKAAHGLIVPRASVAEVNYTHDVPVYFKTYKKLIDVTIKHLMGSSMFWGMLWVNAGPGFNVTDFMMGEDNEIYENKNSTVKPGKENIKSTKKPPWNVITTTKPTTIVENGTATNESVSIPLRINDNIEEKFAQMDKSGNIDVKTNLGDDVEMWASKITSGIWIVKDSDSDGDEFDRKRRDTRGGDHDRPKLPGDEKVVAITESPCGKILQPGWRCLKELDKFSSDATLRLVVTSNSVAIGVLAVAPRNQYGNMFQNLTEVKNLVALSLPSKGLDASKLLFALKKSQFDPYPLKARASISLSLHDFIDIKAVEGLGVFETLKEFGFFINQIFDRAINLPKIKIALNAKVLEKDLKVEYKENMNSLTKWKIFTPRVGSISASGKIRITARNGFTAGMKDIKLQLNRKDEIDLAIKLFGDIKKLVLSLPNKYRLPAVPYSLDRYEGFTVAEVTSSIMAEGEAERAVIGLAVMKTAFSKIGIWQIRCNDCERWKNLSSVFDSSNLRKKRQVLSDKECSYAKETVSQVALLSHNTRLRFWPFRPQHYWKASEAWSGTVLDLALFRILPPEENVGDINGTFYAKAMNDLDNEGVMLVSGTYDIDPNCDVDTPYDDAKVLNFNELLSEKREKLTIERLGCDGKRSSMKIVVDECGVCGGNGKSCVDCSGLTRGGAFIDACGKCVGGSTKKRETILDCGNSCFNTSYIDECGFCQRRNKKVGSVKDCTGKCFGRAYVDRCGACRYKNGTLAEIVEDKKKVIDQCGVCGGNNTKCLGCDGAINSPKILDRCGDCKLLNDTSFSKGCGKVYLIDNIIPPILAVRNPDDVMNFAVTGYFDTYKKATCSLEQLVENGVKLDLGEYDITRKQDVITLKKGSAEIVHGINVQVNASSLLPNGLKFTKWNISCKSNEDGFSSTAWSNFPLLVRTFDPWSLQSIEPDHFPVGQGGDVTITGVGFPDDEKLTCVAPRYVYMPFDALKSAVKFRTLKITKTPATYIDNTQVSCIFPNISVPAKIQVHVLSEYEVKKSSDWSIARYLGKGVTFEYRAKAPKVVEGRVSESLSEIIVNFDTVISFAKGLKVTSECAVLEENVDVLGEKPKCKIAGTKLMIRPGKKTTTPVPASARNEDSSIGEIVIKENTIVARSSDGASQSVPRTTVSILKPAEMKPPFVSLRGTLVLEPCEEATLMVMVYPNVGLWPLTFHWSVVVEENPVNNTAESIVDFLKKQTEGTRGKKISFRDFKGKLQPGANYTISVEVENYFKEKSKLSEMRLHVRSQNSKLRARISNQRLDVTTNQDIKLRIDSKFLKPTCTGGAPSQKLSASLAAKMTLRYIWEAETFDGISLSMDSLDSMKRTLRIRAGFLKPGNYTFKATAFYYDNDVKQGEATASAIIKVSSSPIIVQLKSLYGSVVMSDKDLTLYSKSRDPDGGNLIYSWACETLLDGNPCLIIKEEVGVGNDDAREVVEPAEVAFLRYLSQNGDELKIPARLFKEFTDMKFSLTVRSGDRQKTVSTEIIIKDASANLPTIKIKPIDDEDGFVPSNRLRIKTAIIGNKRKTWRMALTWTCVEDNEYSFIDLSSAAATILNADRDINEKLNRFDLVLINNVLQPSSIYKFRIEVHPDFNIHALEEGKTEADMTVFTDIIIKTINVPTGGDLVVTPTSGTALVTKFTMQADGWLGGDENSPLEYRFAYSAKNAEGRRSSLTPLGEFSEASSLTNFLPPGNPKQGNALMVYSFVRIGENKNTVRRTMAEVIVSPVEDDSGSSEVDKEVIQNMVNEAAEALVSGNTNEILSKVIFIGNSVGKDDDSKKEARDLAESAIESMKTFKPESVDDALDALELVSSAISTFSEGNVTTSSDSKQTALDMMNNILKDLYNKEDSSSRRRRRRAVEDQEVATIPIDMAERMLSLYDSILISSGNDEALEASTKAKFEDDTEFIMKSFCNAVAYGEPTQFAETEYSLVGSRKVDMPYGDDYGKDSLIFSFSNDIEMQYSDWNCDPSTNDTCSGACVSYGRYLNDAIQYDVSGSDVQEERIGPISAFFLRNPSNGDDESTLANTTGLSNVISMFFKNLEVPTGDNIVIECRHLEYSVWSTGSCRVISSTSTEVGCQCDIPNGYFAVFAVTNNTVDETATTTTATTTTATTGPRSSRSIVRTSTTSMEPSTKPAVTCNSVTHIADTCPRKCLDYCHTDGETCEEECVPGVSCICPAGFEKLRGLCVADAECKPRDDNSLGTAAIVGLIIAILAVLITLLVLLFLFYKKYNRGRITPSNSTVEIRGSSDPPEYIETRMDGDDEGSLLADERAGPSGVKNSSFLPTEDSPDPPPEYSEKPKEESGGALAPSNEYV